VGELKAAWVHHSAAADSRYRGSVECTPLVVDGIMYIAGADLVVQAVNASNG
jgi:quinoprotein glucose dehydrogenase